MILIEVRTLKNRTSKAEGAVKEEGDGESKTKPMRAPQDGERALSD